MESTLKFLRLAADPNRLRLLLLLEQEELSVAELQEVLAKGQSQISTNLAQLKQAGLMELLRKAAKEVRETSDDRQALRLVLHKRQDQMRRYFDEMAGKFGRA